MELSRQEYPALLRSLSPNQAVSVLDERFKLIGKINADIADWLRERRGVEEAYVQGLRKLASRRTHENNVELGIFRAPWQSIVTSIQSLAESHAVLAAKIESDVEKPLREYQSRNREMQAVSTVQGNLAAVAKEVDGAHKRAAKLSTGKSSANKVANATSDVEAANQQWESQAPYVFEQLQALDEGRVNHLRDVLTQLETHEVDLVERNRITAETCLNALLNVDTSDEISKFVARISGGSGGEPSIPPRIGSRDMAGSSTDTPPTLSQPPIRGAPTSSQPSVSGAPSRSQPPARGATAPFHAREESHSDAPSPFSTSTRAGTGPPPAKSSFGGLRRLGTVLGRQGKGSKGMDNPSSPEKRGRPSRNPLRRGASSKHDMETIPSPPATSSSDLQASATRHAAPPAGATPTQSIERPPSNQEQQRRNDQLNGDTIQPAPTRVSSLPMPNGVSTNRDLSSSQDSQVVPPAGPPLPTTAETQRDSEGYSVPSSAVDDITRAQREAAAAGDADQPQFKLAIRSEPIQEDDPDAQSAFSSVANTLRAQASQVAAPRKQGAVRGRRDVRNTVFVPSGQSLESAGLGGPSMPPAPPFNLPGSPPLSSETQQGSDAQSVRSAHSLGSLAHPSTITHPQMHQPGLNVSIVETVSATWIKSLVTKAVVIGELALQHNPTDTMSPSGSENVRLENFPVLEKVAPNPSFITQMPSKSGEYSVNLSQITRPSVAFKYQVHLEDNSLAAHAPVSITANWKVEPTQASVILTYAFNPAFVSPAKRSVSLKNVIVSIPVENAKALSCQSKPQGIFAKERSLVYWKLGDMTLDGYAEAPQKLLARFTTESEAKPGSVEMRWEISGEAATGLGSGLSLRQMTSAKEEGGSDPFADEGTSTNASGSWKEVPVTRRIISGKYIAN